MTSIVLDTNVFVSGIFWSGEPYKILELWMDDQIELLASPKIIEEYSRVIELIGKKRKREDLAQYWTHFIVQHASIVETKETFKICRDSQDDKFLDCAASGEVNFLITGDQDLLELVDIFKIKILTPKEFLKVRAAKSQEAK